MKLVNFYISTPQHEKLRQLSKELDLTISELLRRAIDEFLEKYDK